MSEHESICGETREQELLRQIRQAERRAERAEAKVRAFLDWIRNEQEWEYFRSGILYANEPEKQQASLLNAAKLGKYLAEVDP